MKAYPEAKERLIAAGRPAAEVAEMPVFEMIVTDARDTYDELGDQSMCWIYFPYWQARPHLEEAELRLKTAGRRREAIPLASMLVPAFRSVALAKARADRTVAILRVVEAARMYAAAHGGRRPGQLAEIEAVPVPLDPVTGEVFEYALAGDEVLLSSPAGKEEAENLQRPRFRLRLAR